jgi:transposase
MTQNYQRYDEEFKKNIVELHKNGKSQTQLHKEYGVSFSALSKWVRQYAGVKMDDNTIMTAKQIRQLQKEKAALEEENLILKKAIAIFTPHSSKD